jgi:hypothetical protein
MGLAGNIKAGRKEEALIIVITTINRTSSFSWTGRTIILQNVMTVFDVGCSSYSLYILTVNLPQHLYSHYNECLQVGSLCSYFLPED